MCLNTMGISICLCTNTMKISVDISGRIPRELYQVRTICLHEILPCLLVNGWGDWCRKRAPIVPAGGGCMTGT